MSLIQKHKKYKQQQKKMWKKTQANERSHGQPKKMEKLW